MENVGGPSCWWRWRNRNCGKGAEKCKKGAESAVFRPEENGKEAEAGGCSGQEVFEALAEDLGDVRNILVVSKAEIVQAMLAA